VTEIATSESDAELIARLRSEIATLSASNSTLSAELVDARQSLARLRTAYNKALEELHLLKHRLFVAKAERRDTTQEQLAFDNIERTVKTLADQLQDAEDDSTEEPAAAGDETRKRRKSSARRSLSESDLPI
jgi:chromosome segregation ATPase